MRTKSHRNADFQVCCIAGFQTRRLRLLQPRADLEVGDTASLETCATNPQSGIALIIVMIVIFVLAMLAGGFALSMKVETKLAQHADNQTELDWSLGRSGIEYCRWILFLQANCNMEPYDALNQVWAGAPPMGPCVTNGPLGDVQQEVHLGHGWFKWKISDMERKMYINSVIMPGGEALLQQALTLMGVDAGQTTPVVSSIIDWLDTDSNTHLQGAENEYYQSLPQPYSAKNGPIDDISELLLIKGITWEMYAGTGATDYRPGAFQTQNRFHVPGDVPAFTVAMTNLFTHISSGKININTASAEVLQLIPGVDAMCAEQIVAARGGEDDGSGLTGPYRSLDQLRRVPCVTLELLRVMQPFCDVRSRTFEVEIEAHVAGSQRKYVAIIVRPTPRDVQVINFYWKYESPSGSTENTSVSQAR